MTKADAQLKAKAAHMWSLSDHEWEIWFNSEEGRRWLAMPLDNTTEGEV